MQIEVTAARSKDCTFALCLFDGAVYADFRIERKTDKVYLVRISFDGYGCCETSKIRPMSVLDGRSLATAVQSGRVQTVEIATILRRYFSRNDGVIWPEALKDHGLRDRTLSAEGS